MDELPKELVLPVLMRFDATRVHTSVAWHKRPYHMIGKHFELWRPRVIVLFSTVSSVLRRGMSGSWGQIPWTQRGRGELRTQRREISSCWLSELDNNCFVKKWGLFIGMTEVIVLGTRGCWGRACSWLCPDHQGLHPQKEQLHSFGTGWMQEDAPHRAIHVLHRRAGWRHKYTCHSNVFSHLFLDKPVMQRLYKRLKDIITSMCLLRVIFVSFPFFKRTSILHGPLGLHSLANNISYQ